MQRVILPWSRKVSRWSAHTFCYFVVMPNHAECSILGHVLCLNLCDFTWLSLVAVTTYCARLEHSLATRIIFQENNSGYFTIELLDKKILNSKQFSQLQIYFYIYYISSFFGHLFPLTWTNHNAVLQYPFPSVYYADILCPMPSPLFVTWLPGTDLALFAMTSCMPFPTLIPKSLPGKLNSEYLVSFFQYIVFFAPDDSNLCYIKVCFAQMSPPYFVLSWSLQKTLPLFSSLLFISRILIGIWSAFSL